MSYAFTIRFFTRTTEASDFSDIPNCYGVCKTSKRNDLGAPEIGISVYYDNVLLWHVDTLPHALRKIAEKES